MRFGTCFGAVSESVSEGATSQDSVQSHTPERLLVVSLQELSIGLPAKVWITHADRVVDNRDGTTISYGEPYGEAYMQHLDSAGGHSAGSSRPKPNPHEATLARVVKEMDGIFAKFQRLSREQDRDPESELVRIKLGALKRDVSERLPALLQPIGAALSELEFWQPGISSAFYEMWLDPPLPIQGATTWLRYLGQWRAWLTEALGTEAGRVTGDVAYGNRYAAEPPAPSVLWVPGSLPGGAMETERHFTAKDLAELWSLDQSTVRRIFRDDPDVLRLSHVRRRGKRDYVSLRIPASVAARAHERRSRSLFKV
jgi:hypothetical protein